MTRRPYFSHRRAYAPRIWPPIIVAAPLTVALGLWLHPPLLVGAAMGVAIGAGAGSIRWWVWRRRHPVITPGQYIEDLQQKARWN